MEKLRAISSDGEESVPRLYVMRKVYVTGGLFCDSLDRSLFVVTITVGD